MPANDVIKIELINVSGEGIYTQKTLMQQLSKERVRPKHGQAITGRPVTMISQTDMGFIKYRTEYELPEVEARRFVTQALEKEKKIGIHQPEKTWFLIFRMNTDGTEKVEIANISPTAMPLHMHKDVIEKITLDGYIKAICETIKIYMATAIKHEVSIDLSLSNFGLDMNDNVVYLDDDFYRWNQFFDLPEFLASLIRSLDFLDLELIARIGRSLRTEILDYFDDNHWISITTEGLRNVFVAQSREPIRQSLIKALHSTDQFSYVPHNTAKIIALIADIHANAPALNSALNYLAGRELNHTVVLGDVVGYGPHPEQCIELLWDNPNYSIIRGNHDHAVATGKAVSGSTSLAGWTLNWTNEIITEKYRHWLTMLPYYLQTDDWLAVHGSPKDKTFFNGYVYKMSYTENLDILQQREISTCFHGHTHIQKIYYREHGVDGETQAGKNNLSAMSQRLICPGSIGQPRGGIPGVEFAILSLDTCEIEFHRLTYDMENTFEDMRRFNFPNELIDRLKKGY